MTVIASVAALVGVLALATVLGVLLRATTGRAKSVPTRATSETTTTPTADLAPTAAFGTRATLVQFSTPTCARCPATRRQLDAVAAAHDGVTRLEFDLVDRPDLARRFDVMQTPTVLLLDDERTVRTRFGGPPRPPELAAALDTLLTAGHQESR
ncbi:thioredoxin family protein [Curtobacterium sp. MCPF17_002]|uniref:thioredoxin family protein n=1 Tax=Curtobacterium sp. MCPF17_002 TaxID=2175645 RepID=UPI000DA9B08A|nr:thioredoxin family protein [Curtobacterium sp. MCPF17_002]WIB78780.1 thioredoxin family protein [Curtobacterium sp. MCPF17_002]